MIFEDADLKQFAEDHHDPRIRILWERYNEAKSKATQYSKEVETLHLELHQQAKDWCDDDEAVKLQALRVLPKGVVEGDTWYVPRMADLAEMMADEIERLRNNS